MSEIPTEHRLDGTAEFLSKGYEFLPERFRKAGSDMVRTRLMMQEVTCVQGEDAARMFYEPDRFTRKGALPPTTLMALQDLGSVQRMSGPAHRSRKRMFLSLMSPQRVQALGEEFDRQWRARLATWAERGRARLYVEAGEILTRAVCAWAGSPLDEPEAGRRAREFRAMIEGAGSAGPRNWRGLALRARTEHWARRLVRKVREGELAPEPDTALYAVAHHLDVDGERLSIPVAAVEYLNVTRPTVAVDRFIAFCGLALHEHPQWRERLAGDDDSLLEAFVQEVRRFYPFFPAVGGRARQAFEWRGVRFEKGDWVLLDLYGTLHDPRSWTDPERFDPERFQRGEANAFNFIPQGAGEVAKTHRCPGEWITIELMKRAVRQLVSGMTYDVPPQDLSVDLGRMPALPASRFLMTGIRPA
ncbi:cytochrome P450 [Phenylobacterium deserti]|uniref:Cytochrome P450 n=1 Tax=Phenylobacterium deserti TaxID=1914756 RepID=A0A328APP6_9CAUL|nr:cytochrome P450 [Phenylobacterium deserti]RAK56567.1 cytochrome P450 [Phenylobacterium deserti]